MTGQAQESRERRPRRVRDPVYDLYTFKDEIDAFALRIIETAPFQRLRRIKQLGFADHVYPGASHTRFAHSLGVYAATRRIIDVIVPRDQQPDLLQDVEVREAILAALLHDIGHGPFSHAFENVYLKVFGRKKVHEDWTCDIVTHAVLEGAEGGLLGLLKEAQAAGALDLLRGKRENWLSAVFASAFDADRLDYVRRDRLMSGTGTGAIDFTWLLEHVRLTPVPANGHDAKAFAVDRHALQQAETFLMARYQLYDQVYFHKVCRGFECLLGACLQELVRFVEAGRWEAAGLCATNHLVQHLQACLDAQGGESDAHKAKLVETYLRIDDTVLTAALQQMAYAPAEEAEDLRRLAGSIVNRKRPACLDLEQIHLIHKIPYAKVKAKAKAYITKVLKLKEGKEYFFDEPTLSVYGKGAREAVPPHKKLWIVTGDMPAVEIIRESKLIGAQPEVRKIGRLFFGSEAHRNDVRDYLFDFFDLKPKS